MEEARLIAQMHVAEAMLKEADGVIGDCLHGDGTSTTVITKISKLPRKTTKPYQLVYLKWLVVMQHPC